MPSANTKPYYLTDMTESLYVDPVSGEVAIRTGITGNINISGPVTIPGTVTVNSSAADPVHVHLDEVGTSGILAVPYLPVGGTVAVSSVTGNIAGITALPPITGVVSVTGNIAGITALPPITGTVNVTGNIAGITALPPITGTVNANITGGNVIVSGNVGAVVTGNVAITTLPNITGNVAITGGNVGITGNIAGITALPPITGTVSVTGNIAGITALPPITGTVGITGNIAGITALPPITGTVTANQGTNPWVITGTVQSTTPATVFADSDYPMNVARGLVPGQYQELKNGYATGISQNTETTIWNETVLYPWSSWTVAQKLYIISTSASDTGQTIRIEGLDGSYNPITENVVTNGLTAVPTVQNFFRINRGYIIGGNTNAGTITQRLVGGTGTVVGSMAIGFARNKGGFYTVPAGYTAYILYGDSTQFRGGAGNIGGVIRLYVRPFGPGPFLNQFTAEVVNGQYRNDFTVPLPVPEKSDIDVRIVADGNGTQATCNWQMILIAN